MQWDSSLGLRTVAKTLRENYDLKALDFTSWTETSTARERRVALVSTGSFYRKVDQPHRFPGYNFRDIPADAHDVQTNHVSIILERTSFLQDINVALPFDWLDEAAAAVTIGLVALTHYNFNGGSALMGIEGYERYAVEVAGRLQNGGVSTVLFCPL
ncbi:MAG: hypothetical protein GDA49_09270 [Rhodospirillales bacterium]|nr:hypothetical protein [Rhodospirillales bacterium]